MNQTQEYSLEKALIEKCRRGDSKAQMELYQRYYRAMYNTSMRILNHTAEAEDAMQESFLKAFRHIRRFEGRSSFGQWLKQIVIRTSIDLLRKRRVMLSPLDEHEQKLPAEEPDADVRAELEEKNIRAEAVRSAIQHLPDGYRVVLSLYLLEGYDHEEIGNILGISESSSRSQYARARKRLIEELKKNYNHEGT